MKFNIFLVEVYLATIVHLLPSQRKEDSHYKFLRILSPTHLSKLIFCSSLFEYRIILFTLQTSCLMKSYKIKADDNAEH